MRHHEWPVEGLTIERQRSEWVIDSARWRIAPVPVERNERRLAQPLRTRVDWLVA